MSRVIYLPVFICFMLHGASIPAKAQHVSPTCQPNHETFRGQVKEIIQTESSHGAKTEFILLRKFDARGKLLEEEEGSREDWVTATRWRSRTIYIYDELARLISHRAAAIRSSSPSRMCAFVFHYWKPCFDNTVCRQALQGCILICSRIRKARERNQL
jgi:hypothetical protein